MARNLAEVSKCFTQISQRITVTWTPHLPKGLTLKDQFAWTEPSLTAANAIGLSNDIAKRILDTPDGADPNLVPASAFWDSIATQAEATDFVNFPNNPAAVIRSTFEFLLFVQARLPTRKADVDWDKVSDDLVPKRLGVRLRAVEARLKTLEPRSKLIDEKIAIIETAHDTAERLPTDLEELRTGREELDKILEAARKAAFEVDADKLLVESNRQKIVDHEKAALLLVKKCDEAYRITTSAGLAGAFEHRSRTLAWTGWIWVVILMVSLGVGGWLGVDRLNSFKSLLSGEHSTALISLNLLIAIVGVAAPVWLAWLATRSIGQSFRLSEDYAFKSAVSKAYEGYRKEAVNLDEGFARRLFGSALDRLDEAPSRFIVNADHSSPLEAFLANTEIKELMLRFPDLHQKLATLLVEQKTMMTGLVSGGVASVVAAAKGPTRKFQKDEKPEPE